MDSKEKEDLAAKLRQALAELEIDDKKCCLTSPRSPHFWWLIGLMGAAIIALVVVIYCDVDFHGEDVANYVSAFSVLLSILLSIFAIQYTYHSNAQVERQFNDINRAVHNIIETSKELKDTESLMKDAISRIHEHMQSNNNKIDDLTQDFNNLKAQIQNNDPAKYKKILITTQNPDSIKNTSNPATTMGSASTSGITTDSNADEGKSDNDESRE